MNIRNRAMRPPRAIWQLLALCCCLVLPAQARENLPVEAFASLPTITSVSHIAMSPTGEHIVYVRNVQGFSVLVTMNLKTGERNYITRTDNDKYEFRWVQWANAERFLVSLYFPDWRFGIASGETRLLSGDIHSDELKVLARPGHRGRHQHFSQFQDRIVSLLQDDPDHILLALDLEKATVPGLYKIDVKTGKQRRVQRHKNPIRTWVVDQQARVRAGHGFDAKTTERSLWVRRADSDKWHTLETYKAFDRPDLVPLGFGLDPHRLYVRDSHEGRYAIFAIDTASENFDRELVVADEDYDILGDLVHSPKTGDVVGVRHAYAAGSILFFDEQAKVFQDALERAFPDTHNRLVNFSDDEIDYLLYTSASNKAGMYYMGNREAGKISPLISNYPLLDDQPLADSRRISYKARDGQVIEGYLWMPVGEQQEDLPLILFPHGGPEAANRGGFDYWAHFFTHRGYAVLQPNFRGSSDYGHDFSTASLQQWGLAMQDDLEDGVNWLAETGAIDPRRVCIVGSSYGGYAALMGVVKTPDLYQCAISFAGISSLTDMRNHARNFLNKKVVNEMIGTDSDQLRATSPLYHTDRIKVPVLLAHGDRDRVVPHSQSEKMARALKKSGKHYQYLELKNGSHGLTKESNRLALFEAMDAFLATHLPVDR